MTLDNRTPPDLRHHDTLHADVVVIGGGLAGLTAATTAARAGASVVLLDARNLGGRARSALRDGFTLNEGGHALYRSGGGWAVLEGLDVHPRGAVPDATAYRTVWDGEIAPLPIAPKSIATSRLLGTRSKLKLAGWFNDIAGAAVTAGDRSLDVWLDDQRARPDLRTFVLTLARLTTYSARPENMPARAVLRQFGLGGVVYVDGGWQSLVDALTDRAEAAGVRVLDHEPVTAVDGDQHGWNVSSPDRTIRSGSVVFAAGGPQLAANLLGDDPAAWVERAGPVQRAACLDVGGAPGDVVFLQSADEPLYLSAHAPTAELAPAGQTLYSVMRYLAPDDTATAADRRASLERHAARAGLPDRSDRLVDRFLAGPVVTWGSPQVGVERPTGLELAARGLFAAGDWIGEPLLADASLVSGAGAGAAAARRAMVAV
jgi:glycine/D-amino acid oxidase-like deaminating enzyme